MPFGPRIPVRLDIDTLMRAIVESLSSWHERVAAADSLTYPYAGCRSCSGRWSPSGMPSGS